MYTYPRACAEQYPCSDAACGPLRARLACMVSTTVAVHALPFVSAAHGSTRRAGRHASMHAHPVRCVPAACVCPCQLSRGAPVPRGTPRSWHWAATAGRRRATWWQNCGRKFRRLRNRLWIVRRRYRQNRGRTHLAATVRWQTAADGGRRWRTAGNPRQRSVKRYPSARTTPASSSTLGETL